MMRMRRYIALTWIAVLMLLTAACGAASPDAPPAGGSPPGDTPTIDTIYARLAETLDRPEMLYYERIETTYDDPGDDTATRPPLITERWSDPRHNLIREEMTDGVNRWRTISTSDGVYTLDVDQVSVTNPPPCPSGTFIAAAVIGCPDAGYTTWVFPTPGSVASFEEAQATPVVTIEPGQIDGQPAIVVIAVVDRVQYRVGRVVETTRTTLDPETFLPYRRERERQCCDGGGEPVRERSTIAGEFIPAGSVASDFFDPASLASLRPDPLTTIDEAPFGYTLYWLGSEFAGSDPLPPLVLWSVERYHQQDWPAGVDQMMLDYRRADAPFAREPAVRLTEYARQAWDTLAAAAGPDGPCWTTREIALPNGQATIYLGYSWPDAVPPSPDDCPTNRQNDRFVAYAFLGETVVVVDYPADSLDAIAAVVRALIPRES